MTEVAVVLLGVTVPLRTADVDAIVDAAEEATVRPVEEVVKLRTEL